MLCRIKINCASNTFNVLLIYKKIANIQYKYFLAKTNCQIHMVLNEFSSLEVASLGKRWGEVHDRKLAQTQLGFQAEKTFTVTYESKYKSEGILNIFKGGGILIFHDIKLCIFSIIESTEQIVLQC